MRLRLPHDRSGQGLRVHGLPEAVKYKGTSGREGNGMTKSQSLLLLLMLAAGPAALGGLALAAQDRYTVQVPGGLAFSEFRGYENWQLVAVAHNGEKLDAVFGNPAMIEAYKA